MQPNNHQPQQPPQSQQPTTQSTQQNGPVMPNPPANQLNQPNQPLQSSKSHLGLIIGIVVSVIIMIAGMLGAYFFYFSDSAVSKRTSNSFMTAMTSGDVATALEYTDGSTETQNFLNSMKEGMQGQFKLKESANKNDTYYYLYSLTNANNQAARTELSKSSGEWQVNALYTGGADLAVMGSQSSVAEQPSEPTSNTVNTSCLVQSDFDNWYKQRYNKTATEEGFNFQKPENMYTTNVKFQPDSIEYTDKAFSGSSIESIVDLAKSVSGKTYTVRLEGSVATTAPADLDFAKKRANKVKDQLVAGGVPASKIVIEEPNNITDISDPSRVDEVTKEAARNVVLKFDPTCSGGSSSSTGR